MSFDDNRDTQMLFLNQSHAYIINALLSIQDLFIFTTLMRQY